MRPWLIAGCLVTLLACGGNGGGGIDAAPSGRACATGLDAGAPTALASPALECPSRVCLHVQGAPGDLCSAFCEDPGDCAAAAESACTAGFACTAPTASGPFACRAACVCASAVPAGGFPTTCPR